MCSSQKNQAFELATKREVACHNIAANCSQKLFWCLWTCHLAHIIRFKCSFSHDTTVHHDKLIGRLESDLGLTDNVLAWFKSYLSDRFQCVFVNVSLSDQFPLKQGNKKMSLLNVQVKMHTNIYKFNIIG